MKMGLFIGSVQGASDGYQNGNITKIPEVLIDLKPSASNVIAKAILEHGIRTILGESIVNICAGLENPIQKDSENENACQLGAALKMRKPKHVKSLMMLSSWVKLVNQLIARNVGRYASLQHIMPIILNLWRLDGSATNAIVINKAWVIEFKRQKLIDKNPLNELYSLEFILGGDSNVQDLIRLSSAHSKFNKGGGSLEDFTDSGQLHGRLQVKRTFAKDSRNLRLPSEAS